VLQRRGSVVGPGRECASREAFFHAAIYTFHRKREAPDHFGVKAFRLEDFDPGPGHLASARHAEHDSANKNAASVSRSGVSYSNIERGGFLVLGRPGSDLLSQGLSHSTIGAEAFNGRVRDGIGLRRFAKTTRPAKDKKTKQAIF
jgi:hypothetical protein